MKSFAASHLWQIFIQVITIKWKVCKNEFLFLLQNERVCRKRGFYEKENFFVASKSGFVFRKEKSYGINFSGEHDDGTFQMVIVKTPKQGLSKSQTKQKSSSGKKG